MVRYTGVRSPASSRLWRSALVCLNLEIGPNLLRDHFAEWQKRIAFGKKKKKFGAVEHAIPGRISPLPLTIIGPKRASSSWQLMAGKRLYRWPVPDPKQPPVKPC